MHGDYEEMHPQEPEGWDWRSGLLVTLLVGFVALSWFASGCAEGAEPTFAAFDPPAFAAFETPAAGVGGGGGTGSTPPPVQTPRVLLGWNVPQPDGTVRFVPATSPVVSEPSRPFAAPPGTGATTGITVAPFAGVISTSSPAPVRDRVRTGTFVLPGIRGGIENCGTLG